MLPVLYGTGIAGEQRTVLLPQCGADVQIEWEHSANLEAPEAPYKANLADCFESNFDRICSDISMSRRNNSWDSSRPSSG